MLCTLCYFAEHIYTLLMVLPHTLYGLISFSHQRYGYIISTYISTFFFPLKKLENVLKHPPIAPVQQIPHASVLSYPAAEASVSHTHSASAWWIWACWQFDSLRPSLSSMGNLTEFWKWEAALFLCSYRHETAAFKEYLIHWRIITTIFYMKKQLGEFTRFPPGTREYMPGLGFETCSSDFQTCNFSIMWTP